MLLPTLVPAVLLALGVAQAGGADDDGSSVDVTVTRVQVDSVTLREVKLSVDTELTRTAWPSVLLRSVDYRVLLGDDVLAEGETDMDPVRLRKGRTKTVALPVTLHTLSALGALGGDALGGTVDLRLAGHVKTRFLFIPLSVPFRQRLVDVDLSG